MVKIGQCIKNYWQGNNQQAMWSHKPFFLYLFSKLENITFLTWDLAMHFFFRWLKYWYRHLKSFQNNLQNTSCHEVLIMLPWNSPYKFIFLCSGTKFFLTKKPTSSDERVQMFHSYKESLCSLGKLLNKQVCPQVIWNISYQPVS